VAERNIGSDGVRTGWPVDAVVTAAPTSKRAKVKHPKVVLTVVVSRDDCTHEGAGIASRAVLNRINWAPCVMSDPVVMRALAAMYDGEGIEEAAAALRAHSETAEYRKLWGVPNG